ncbi:receptor-like protein 15 [Macadamia integrifolia]|uniref:receptor-like protein 15 n=1 Tax=Macadamia integrifolia TaxID=60698 RepID=UPI001C52BC10|nr:receptor-like protein 15 [Macadamia integrifolia]
MKLPLVKCLWVPLVLLLLRFQYWCCCLGCLEEERIALLEFKASCNWNTYFNGDHLPSWVSDERGSSSSSDCCSWERVQCNATTGRIIQLSLSDLGGVLEEFDSMNIDDEFDYRSIFLRKSGCYLNVTLFSTFKELHHLNLSNNEFNGWTNNEGFESLVGLRKLEVLDLTYNNFNDSIFPSLGELKSLRTLSLGENQMPGSIHLEEIISTMHKLESLDLSGNFLEDSSQTKQGSTSLIEMAKLKALYLYGNNFKNSILSFMGTLTSLRTLSLGANNLEGSLHMEELTNLQNLQSLDLSGNNINCSSQSIQELANLHDLQSLDLSGNNFNCSSQGIQALCRMKKLQELHLSGNNFEGILPPCLQNLTSLRILDLSHNQFRGNIPSSLIAGLSSLSHIFLGHNDFEGTFTFKSFANIPKLEVIDFNSAGNKLEIETEQPSWIPLFQLKVLLLSNSNLNKQTNAIPRFLSSQYNLIKVDLSHCNLSGLLPPWLLENNKMLRFLTLRNNSLRGHFQLPSYVHSAARIIDISHNCIDGLLQEDTGNIFPNGKYLNLSVNNFEGVIPSSIGSMSYLSFLDLSNNNFLGEIPNHMAIGCSNLFFLGLSNNKLHGQVFPPHFNFTKLFILHLDNNSFSGNILSGLSKCNLGILDISNNQLTGRIPSWIGNLTSLMVLNMGGNTLEGNIPIEFQVLEQLEFLDLSQNHLSGPIASLSNLTSLERLHLQGNGFIGSLSTALVNNSILKILDIGRNNLCGGIPDWMGALSGLRVLLLTRNHLSGTIPNHLCQLEWMHLMDLSHNSLSGSIPRCFINITYERMTKMRSLSETEVIDGFQFFLDSLSVGTGIVDSELVAYAKDQIEFVTKSWSRVYRGVILAYMSGMDLSCNNLINDIPHEIGDSDGLLALNLSHNQLSGSIPKTFSNLKQIESLDLSYNKLTGEIPSEFTTLNTLEVFIVAHNNLSGRTPEMKGQFSTFDNTSYEGNPFLCGLPLPNACNSSNGGESTSTFPTVSNDMDNKYDIDMRVFAASFTGSYVVCLLAFATILYINPYWRRMLLHFIEECIYSCYYFLSDTYYKLCIHIYRFRLLLSELIPHI